MYEEARYFLSAGVAKANTGKLHLEYSVRQCLDMCTDVCVVSSLELLGETLVSCWSQLQLSTYTERYCVLRFSFCCCSVFVYPICHVNFTLASWKPTEKETSLPVSLLIRWQFLNTGFYLLNRNLLSLKNGGAFSIVE